MCLYVYTHMYVYIYLTCVYTSHMGTGIVLTASVCACVREAGVREVEGHDGSWGVLYASICLSSLSTPFITNIHTQPIPFRLTIPHTPYHNKTTHQTQEVDVRPQLAAFAKKEQANKLPLLAKGQLRVHDPNPFLPRDLSLKASVLQPRPGQSVGTMV